MILDFGKIEAIKEARQYLEALKEKEREMLMPAFPPSMINEMFTIFCDITDYRNKKCAEAIFLRRAFLFVALYLCNPASLIGNSLPRGLRHIFAFLFGINSPTAISQDCRSCVFQFNTYNDFREKANFIHDAIVSRLSPHTRA